MGTRIEPTISSDANDGLAADDAVHAQPGSDHALAAHPPAAADSSADPTLEELAALENEVDNWLHPPARVAPEPVGGATPQAELPPPPPAPAFSAPAAPRKKRAGAWWALGVAAVAAAFGIAMFADGPAQPDPALDPVAASPAPAQPAAAPLIPEPAPASATALSPAPPPAKRPDMVFLDERAPVPAKAALPVAPPPAPEPVPDALDIDAPEETTAEVTQAPVRARKTTAPKETRPSRRPPAEPEVARRSQTWPGDRRASDAARVDAAMAKCRAESANPGACNIRVCDVLGSSHPACR